ncbi:MAG: response regulator [Candidatus Polarisedimenticolia bacterium]
MRLPRPAWKSLSSEIALVYASLSITLVVLLSYLTYQLNSRVLEERIRQEMLFTVDETLQAISRELEERIRETQVLSLTPTLKQAALVATDWTQQRRLENASEEMVATALSGRPFPGEVHSFLNDLKEAHPYLAELIVTDRYGIHAVSSNPTSDFRQNDEPWWQLAVAQRLYFGRLEYDASAACYSYAVAMAIPDDPRPPIGVIKVVFNFKAIQQLVRSAQVGGGGYVILVSDDGIILSHPDAHSVFRDIRDDSSLSSIAPLLQASLRGVEEFSPPDGSEATGRWLLGHSRLMRPSSLGPLNWTVAAVASRAESVAPIAQVRNRSVFIGLAFLLAAVPVVMAASRRLLRPLENLATSADRIRQGDLHLSFSAPSGNEIGRLADTLSSMLENLKAAHRRTLDINAGLERTVRDRTDELQRKNRQIEAQNKKVLEANRMKSQFLANMSHELRTPLNAVLALSDIMANEMSGTLNEEQMKQITTIHRSGKSLLRLINDVLDLSKIEAGRMSVEKVSMSLGTLITLVSDTLRPLAEDKNLSLSVKTSADLPQYITSDEHKLRQILVNLLGNAIKFTDRGEVSLAVSFQKDTSTLSFFISDTGIGIAAEALDRIFEEFHQADGSTTRKYGGTGLGLTISKRMAELMGGTLTVRSVLGQGSTFALTVPYVPSSPVPATAVETLRRVRMQVPEPALINTSDDSVAGLVEGRPTVLVAEDELDNLYIMKKYLNRNGCQVVFARDGNEVLQKAKKYKPIAITLDLVLPKKNGWDVLSELKSDPETRNIPVIIASVLDNQERGFCLGAYRYLVKPVSEAAISDTIYQIQWSERKDVKRILIVDDNIVDSDLMTRLLPESKYQVLHASSGHEGIATATREKPDLIMLDLNMPEMDGFQVLDALKKHPETSSIPVVIYTAKDLTLSEQAKLKNHAERVFLKNPLEPARMLSEIGSILKTLPQVEPKASSEGKTLLPSDVPQTTVPMGPFVPAQNPSTGVILLVEDDAANQYTLQLMLASEGYEVQVADNGREALDKIEKLQPDIVLMDMMMPVMGGHEATRAIKANPAVQDIPVIALTAAAMPGDREKALAAGCDDYITKPVERAFLLERVEHWIQSSASEF